MKLILPAGALTPQRQDMVKRIDALREAVIKGGVREIAMAALFPAELKGAPDQVAMSGTCSSDSFVLFALSYLDNVTQCCTNPNCPRHREHLRARDALTQLAGVGSKPPLRHENAPRPGPALASVNGAKH